MKSGEIINLGIPADYPTSIAEALKKYCHSRKEIKNSYLALMYNSTSKEEPELIIGLDITSHFKEISLEIGDALKPYAKNNEAIDIIDVSTNDTFSKSLKQKQFQIY